MPAPKNVILLFLVNVLTVTFALRAVSISKCCNKDEVLVKQDCAKNDSSAWNLRVYNGRHERIEYFNYTLPSHWKIQYNTRPDCRSPVRLTYQSHNNFPILNGSLMSMEYGKVFHPDQFCLDYNAALVCIQPQPITHVIIRKCCGTDALYIGTNMSCKQFRGDTYHIDVGPGKTLGAGFPECENIGVMGELNDSKIMNNGSLLLNDTLLLPAEKYCLEHILEHTGRSPRVLSCLEYLSPYVEQEQSQMSDLRFTLYPIGLALSAIFLAATLAAGTLLPANYHLLHWRCQTNHVACLLVGDVLLCIVHLSGRMEYGPCFAIAVFMHFLFLAAFFWLNTMCFNIWWTFRDLRAHPTERNHEILRFRLYAAYAWGIPLLITVIAASLDLSNRDNNNVLRPRFAENKCWFFDDIEKLTFFLGPVGVLLFINLILFALTTRELTCGLWKSDAVKSTSERAVLGRVCMKLVIVMGVSWIAELLSFASGGPREVWYIPDLINCLHGVFIFIVVGCQPQVLTAAKKLWCLRRHRQNGTAGTANHHSSSSQGLPSMGDTLTNSVTNGTTKSPPLETSC